MNKLPEIRLPTLHGKEWAAVAITAVVLTTTKLIIIIFAKLPMTL